MRIPALAIFTTATVLTAAPTRAQTYDPAYPVCLHVYTRGANYYECRYASLPQCNASASGRAAVRYQSIFCGRASACSGNILSAASPRLLVPRHSDYDSLAATG